MFLTRLWCRAAAPVGRWLSPCFGRSTVACAPLFPASRPHLPHTVLGGLNHL